MRRQPVEIFRVPRLVPEQSLRTTEDALHEYKQWHTFRDRSSLSDRRLALRYEVYGAAGSAPARRIFSRARLSVGPTLFSGMPVAELISL